jgi:thiamine biosynthesis lipoprotein
MYTVVSITVLTDSEKKASLVIDDAYKELDKLADLLNFYSENSEISYVNKNAGVKPVKVSQETYDIVKKALFVSDNTDGTFDITIGPVVKLWDFKNKRLPDAKELKEKLKTVGYKNIILNEKDRTIFIKKKGVQIDLGGIIKGFAADKIVLFLKNRGIKAGIIAVGGDIKTFGMRPDGKPWTIGIQNPRQTSKDDEIIGIVKLGPEMAISTSGDYEKYFLLNGKRYHHLLDPKTGYPSNKNRSVTIISHESALSDAFATAIFLIDAEKGIKILKSLGLEGIIIDKDGKIFITDGINDRLTLFNR